MNKKTITITIIVVAVLILVIAATLYYSISNIAYYNQNGQLAAVATNGYGGGVDTENWSESLNVELIKESVIAGTYKVYFKDFVSSRTNDANIDYIIGKQLPKSSLEINGKQNTYTGSFLADKDGKSVVSPIIENGRHVGDIYRVLVENCERVTQYSRANSVNVYGSVPDLQLKSWVTDWNRVVNLALKSRGIASRNNNYPGIYFGPDYFTVNNSNYVRYYMGNPNTCLERYIAHGINDPDQENAFMEYYLKTYGLSIPAGTPVNDQYFKKVKVIRDSLSGKTAYTALQKVVINNPATKVTDIGLRKDRFKRKVYETMGKGGSWLIANDFAVMDVNNAVTLMYEDWSNVGHSGQKDSNFNYNYTINTDKGSRYADTGGGAPTSLELDYDLFPLNPKY